MANKTDRITGRLLNAQWQVGARHALYRADGKWYHHLTTFPAALFDASGYMRFETEQEYQQCAFLLHRKQLHVPLGISTIPNYIRVVSDTVQTNEINEQRVPYHYIDHQGTQLAEEIASQQAFPEGAIQRIIINRYERNPQARKACIQHYGYVCAVCSFDFTQTYGDIGEAFIHIHHRIPLATIGSNYAIDPVRDLIPVCPNCHAMLHRVDPPFTIEALRERIDQRKALV